MTAAPSMKHNFEVGANKSGGSGLPYLNNYNHFNNNQVGNNNSRRQVPIFS
jgi:hypothetical protein